MVEGALLRIALTFNNATLIEQATIKRNRVGTLNRMQSAAPGDIFKARDGWIITQVIGGPLFERWARLMGEEHWCRDPRFASDQARGDNAHLISERMSRWIAERSTAEVIAAMEEARLPLRC